METHQNKVLNIWSKDNNQIMLLFLISIVSVYYLPFKVNQIVFLVYLFFAYKSKKDYLWIAFFFILIDAPGRLFEGGVITDIHRIPFYPIIAGITLSFEELFIFMYLLKTVVLKRKFRFIFKKDFTFLTIYTVLVLVYSLVLGMSSDVMISTFRMLIPWSFIYIIVKLFVKESDFDKLNRLLFPFVFLALASQVYSYLTGNYFGRFLKGISLDTNLLLLSAESEQASRAADSSIILIYCFTMALFYLSPKRKAFPRYYLYIIIIFSMLSVFLSGTRGWIIAFFSFLFLVLFTARKSKNIKHYISIGALATVVIGLFLFFFPLVKVQMKRVSDRVVTVVDLAEGDITARGTLSRLSQRGPKVLKKFKESPLLGWGFSTVYFENADRHVGHHNILLNVGIIGYIILNFIFFKWCMCMYRFSRFKPVQVNYGQNAIKILYFAFLAMYIIHSSSAQSWGFDIKIPKVLFYTLLIAFFSIIERSLKRQTKISSNITVKKE